jgi:hypothetical protein
MDPISQTYIYDLVKMIKVFHNAVKRHGYHCSNQEDVDNDMQRFVLTAVHNGNNLGLIAGENDDNDDDDNNENDGIPNQTLDENWLDFFETDLTNLRVPFTTQASIYNSNDNDGDDDDDIDKILPNILDQNESPIFEDLEPFETIYRLESRSQNANHSSSLIDSRLPYVDIPPYDRNNRSNLKIISINNDDDDDNGDDYGDKGDNDVDGSKISSEYGGDDVSGTSPECGGDGSGTSSEYGGDGSGTSPEHDDGSGTSPELDHADDVQSSATLPLQFQRRFRTYFNGNIEIGDDFCWSSLPGKLWCSQSRPESQLWQEFADTLVTEGFASTSTGRFSGKIYLRKCCNMP